MSDLLTLERPQSQLSWADAVAIFRERDVEAKAAVEREYDAEEAADDAHPREARFFDVYNLGMGMSRDRAFRTALMACCLREFGCTGKPIYPKEARDDYEARLPEITAEAERVADEFTEYQERSRAVDRKFRLDELGEETRAAWKRWAKARDALMAIPAPDHAGLLVKLEIALDCDHEHLHEIALADARRLLGSETA